MRGPIAQKGEAGGWSVYWEGVDSDGDGFLNEDGVGGVELDRNFPHGIRPTRRAPAASW